MTAQSLEQPNARDAVVPVLGSVAVVIALAALVAFLARRRPLRVVSGVEGAALELEPRHYPGQPLKPIADTDPAPAPELEHRPPASACAACRRVVASRALPRAERQRFTLDPHAGRLYGAPRTETIKTRAGRELCLGCEHVAVLLLEQFHAKQRARFDELAGELAEQAADFDGAGLLELVREKRGRQRKGRT